MGAMFYKKEQAIDFAQVDDVESIKELILHHCIVTNFSCITAAKALKAIALVDCNVTSEDLGCLKEMEKLKTISLNIMKLDSILCLAEISSLRELSLRGIDGINYEELENFTKLQSLSIQETAVITFDFMKKLKNLKVLEFNKVPISDLNFLYNLSKLKEFTMQYRADDETALECISEMKYLQRFQYPVPDMKIYKECPKIYSIGIDASRVADFSILDGKETITNVMLYNLKTEKQYERQIAELEKYLNLNSYGYEKLKSEVDGEYKMINGNENWQKIVEKSRKLVKKRYPELCNSLDFGAYIYPIDYFVSFIFYTNKELEEAKESGLTDDINEYFKTCMKDNGYPIEAIKNCDFASQEQCEKDYSGNWFYYYK